jgi:predicted alpha/beta superfamily hydrolase
MKPYFYQKSLMKSKLILFTLCCIIANMVHAQDTVIRRFDTSKLDSIQSAVLDQKRFIEVFVPQSYQPGSTDKYDVLYVLDGGNWNTGLINYIQHFAEGEGYMPPTIVVSIMGIDRNKDLTPTHLEQFKTSGGATNFLKFIKEELIPYINKTYPSNGENTLWGHSFGGLFVINAMLLEPNTFKSYIAADPSLWWDDQYIKRIAPASLPALAGQDITLFISARAGSEGAGMRIAPFDSLLEKQAPASLTWKSRQFPNETHSSVRFQTIYEGLRFTYGWTGDQIKFHPINGIITPGKPIKVWYFGDTSRVHYTLDGSAPVITSPQATLEMTVSDAAKVTMTKFTNRARYNKSQTGEFKTGQALKPVSKPKGITPGGLHYAYYEGNTIKQQGRLSKAFSLDKLPGKKNFSLVMDGYIESKEEGYYIFVLDGEKDTKVYLDDQLLVEQEGSYILPLQKGFYPLRVEFKHGDGDYPKLNVMYLTPSILDTKNPIEVPLELQYAR